MLSDLTNTILISLNREVLNQLDLAKSNDSPRRKRRGITATSYPG